MMSNKEKRFLIIDNEEIEIGSARWVEDVLSGDPFEGDYFDGHVFEDKILKARNTKTLCHTCYSVMTPGTFNRNIVLAESGEIIKARFCEDCCHDLGYGEVLFEGNKYYDLDDDEAWEKACTWDAKKKEWIEPRELYEVREEIRQENVKYLEKIFGKRYFEASKAELYETMIKKGV